MHLTTASRRALIGAAVIAPALATPALTASADAELLQLVHRWREARAAEDRHYAGPFTEAEERYQKAVGSKQSDALRARPADWGVGLLSPGCSHFQIEDLRRVLAHRRCIKGCFAKYPTEANARELSRSSQVAAELVTLRARERTAMEVSALHAATVEGHRLTAITRDLEQTILRTKAHTIPGAAGKAAVLLSLVAAGDEDADALRREIGELL